MSIAPKGFTSDDGELRGGLKGDDVEVRPVVVYWRESDESVQVACGGSGDSHEVLLTPNGPDSATYRGILYLPHVNDGVVWATHTRKVTNSPEGAIWAEVYRIALAVDNDWISFRVGAVDQTQFLSRRSHRALAALQDALNYPRAESPHVAAGGAS